MERDTRFHLKMTIISGENLLACDKGDVSDPYVKLCQDKTVLFKTTIKNKTVNPCWNEEFIVQVNDTKNTFLLQVFDKDNLSFDDFMGQAELDLGDFQLDKVFDVTLQLDAGDDKKLIKKTKKNELCLGKIKINLKLSNTEDDKTVDRHDHLDRSMINGKEMQEETTSVIEYLERNKEQREKDSFSNDSSLDLNTRTGVESSVTSARVTQNYEDVEYENDNEFREDVSSMMQSQKDNEEGGVTGNQSYVDDESKVKDGNSDTVKEDDDTRAELKHENENGDTIEAFLLRIEIVSGDDLLACDKGNVSDPYVKVCQDKIVLFKTSHKHKTVNPVWNEGFSVQIEDRNKPIWFQVFDNDKFTFDDFMGEAEFDLANIKLDESFDVMLQLGAENKQQLLKKPKKNQQSLGNIKVNIKLSKVDKKETKKPSFFKKITKQFTKERLATSEEHSAIVHVVLVQARSLALMQGGTDCDPYCQLSLANQKYTSKIIRDNINPKWREAFNFYRYEDADDFLHIEICHNDDRISKNDEFLGSVALDLRNFSPEVSHNIWKPLLGEKGVHVGDVHVILTVTCCNKPNSPSMYTNWNSKPEQEAQLMEKYHLRNSFTDLKDIGHLSVKVVRAEGLASTDYNGLADPFVVLELKNARVRTLAIRESLNPQWNQVFNFNIKDMNDRLEVTIFDENDNIKEDFLGKVMIPLLTMDDDERKWFKLKDKRLWKPANGENPRIQLEIGIDWNPIRAAYRTTIEPEIKYMEKDNAKFELKALTYNCYRVKNEILKIISWTNYLTGRDLEGNMKSIQKIFDWESKVKSLFVCCAFVIAVWFFDIWMIPFALLIPFVLRFMGVQKTEEMKKEVEAIDYEEEDMDLEDDKSTFARMKEIGLIVQTKIGFLANIIESVGNLFNFSAPFLSKIAFMAILLVTILLYFLPFRICLICWGLHKLTLRLFFPDCNLFNQSLINFLSAVPNDEVLTKCKEIQETPQIQTVDPRIVKKLSRDKKTI